MAALASRYLAITALSLAILLSLTAGCSPSRTFEAWALLDDLDAGPGASSLEESRTAPTRRLIRYGPEGGGYRGDLYETDRPGAPLVLVPGAAPGGKDEPRLIFVAETFARRGFTVLVPDIVSLRQLNVSSGDSRHIAAAVVRAASATGLAGKPAVGILAVSYATGPAVIAASEPPAKGAVAFILSVGGYYDLESVITFFTTGRYRDGADGEWQHRRPNEYGKWVFLRSNAARLQEWRDRTLLETIADRKMYDPGADVGTLIARLGPEGRSVMRLLSNEDPEQVGDLVAALPAGVRGEIMALDLKRRDLSAAEFDMILLHGRSDPIIPETESQALARALPEEKAHLYLLDGLDHVELGPKNFSDRILLLLAATRLLEIRDSILAQAR